MLCWACVRSCLCCSQLCATYVSTSMSWNSTRMSWNSLGFHRSNVEACARTLDVQGLVWLPSHVPKFVHVCLKSFVLEPCISKALPDCHHQHPSLVSEFVHGVLEDCRLRATVFTLKCTTWLYWNVLAFTIALCAKACLFQCLAMSTSWTRKPEAQTMCMYVGKTCSLAQSEWFGVSWGFALVITRKLHLPRPCLTATFETQALCCQLCA